MQKRSEYEIICCPIRLPEGRPLEISAIAHQSDREITYLHRHNYMEFCLCLGGSGIFLVGGRVIPFQTGDAIAIPAAMPHLAQSTPGTQSSWIWLYLDFPRLLVPFFPGTETAFLTGLHGSEYNPKISDADPEFGHLLQELRTTPPDDREALAALALLLLRRMQRHFQTVSVPATEPPEGVERIQAALQYLSQHYREETVSLARAARLCHISPVHFRRLFKRATGVTPQQYVHGLRIAMAQAELRRHERPIGEIAGRCGYGSLSSFNRQFKFHTGQSPSDYRTRER